MEGSYHRPRLLTSGLMRMKISVLLRLLGSKFQVQWFWFLVFIVKRLIYDGSSPEECKPLFEAMDRSLENLDRLEVQTGGCLVPRGLCIATIKAIDGALRQLGPLCDPKHPVQEDFDGAANSGSKSPVGGSEAELDTPNRSKSPLRNAALTYDEYMKALVDDVQAEKDRVMFEEAVTVENVGQQIDNTRRVLDRSQLGLKPVPKRKPNGKNVKDGAEKPPLPRRKYVARRGGAASSAGGSKAKKGTKKVKKHDILDEVTKKQMHSATQLSLLRTEVNGSFFHPDLFFHIPLIPLRSPLSS